MDVRIAAPRDLWPPDDVVATAHELAAVSGARLLVTEDVSDAVQGADFLYTDVWVSMGEPPEVWAKRVPMLLPYQINEALMASTGNADTKLLHCLPAVHDRSTVLGERLWTEYYVGPFVGEGAMESFDFAVGLTAGRAWSGGA